MKTKNIELIIFDLDGTLVETREDITDAVNYVRLRYKLPPLSLGTVSDFVGDGIIKLIERVFPGAANTDFEDRVRCFKDYYALHLIDKSKVYPGVFEFLEKNNSKIYAVISNKADKFTTDIINKLDLAKYFSIVMGSSEDIPKKPAPEMINIVLKELNIQPHNALIIGDTKNDILAGKNAGLFTVAVSYGFRDKKELLPYRPDILIDSIDELNKILEY